MLADLLKLYVSHHAQNYVQRFYWAQNEVQADCRCAREPEFREDVGLYDAVNQYRVDNAC